MAVFLPIVPNWQNGVRDTYEFKTSIFATRDGSEQRRSLRIQPRRTIQAGVILDGDRLRLFQDALNRARDGKVEIGDFSAPAATLQETAAAGETVLRVDAVPRWMQVSITCVLLTGRTSRKVRIDFISGNTVVLRDALKSAAGAGARFYPQIAASLESDNTLSMHTTMISTSSLSLVLEPGSIVREADPLPADGVPEGETSGAFGPAAIFYGRYVLLRKPNYMQQPQIAFNLKHETVDYGRGVTKTFTPVPMIARTVTATHMALSHADAMALLDVFIRAKGRAGEIYVPTWGSDFPRVVAISADSIKVEGTEFFDTYATDPAHAAILIRAADGRLIPHEISRMYVSNGDTWVVCDTLVGLQVADIAQISWMFVCRFAQDAMTIEWRTGGVANITVSYVTLRNLAVESAFGSNWILATGYWRERGQWEDSAEWSD